MDHGIDWSAALEQDAAAYADLLAGFQAFTLYRSVRDAGVIRGVIVYRGDAPDEVGQLRQLLTANPSTRHCMCIGGTSISLEGGAVPAVLSVHHGQAVRWRGARCGDFDLEHGRELAEWLAAHGVPDCRPRHGTAWPPRRPTVTIRSNATASRITARNRRADSAGTVRPSQIRIFPCEHLRSFGSVRPR